MELAVPRPNALLLLRRHNEFKSQRLLFMNECLRLAIFDKSVDIIDNIRPMLQYLVHCCWQVVHTRDIMQPTTQQFPYNTPQINSC